MILIITTLILLVTIMIIGISHGKEKLEKELCQVNEKLNQLEKKLARQKGRKENN